MALTFVFSIAGQVFSFFWNLIAGQLLEKLSSPIIQELSLTWGLRDDLCRLKNTVSSVRAVLLDAQERRSNSHQLNDWLEKLEVVLYRAEDVLEEFIHYKASNKSILTKVLREFSRSNRVFFRFKMAHKIKKIREEFDEISADRSKFNLVERANESVVIRKTTHSFVRDEEVIGSEDEKLALISFLNATSDDESLSALPIVGSGGMGNATLAKLVFNDERIVTQFDLRIWVSIPEDFELEKVIKAILKFSRVADCDNLPLELLQQCIREKLKDQKFLLILDYVWNGDHGKWVDLKNLLMGGARGSKIVITTCFPKRKSSVTIDPLLPVSSQESTGSSDLTPSYTTTLTKHVVAANSAVRNKSVETENASDNTCIVAEERDLLVNRLRRVQTEVMNSTGIDLRSRNSVVKLIDVAVEGILGLPDEEDQFEKLLAMKCKTLMLSFLLVFLAVMVMVYVFSSGEQSSYRGPLPT